MENDQTIPENADIAKGRVKESAGALIGDDELEREGEQDQAAGKAKEVIDDVADKAKKAADSLKEKFS